MKPIEGIFSIRIVVADYYMQRPKIGLDPCFSQFRSNEIKSVPIIRIFGSNAEGQKTCMHIHGVFPYFYIPYESKDLGTVDTFKYKIATCLDKAINITLGQGSSKTQHVFKVELVQGIPFYGYHKNEHQYLKIFLYHPRFIKKAANLFQNGVILGKHFQPHESHVPYMLQFLIDYNLYGMSFLHVPKEIVKFRKNESEDVLYKVNSLQILENDIQKMSTSQLECDSSAAYILNRFQLGAKQTEHTNPGIEAIWQDEKNRRKNLLSEDNSLNIPKLELPEVEVRLNVKPTESETFYRDGLEKKIKTFNETSNESISSTLPSSTSLPTEINLSIAPNLNLSKKNNKLNLHEILANSVYPEECSQNENLINASIIHDHIGLSKELSKKSSNLNLTTTENDENLFEDSLLDETVISSLTQKMNMQDYEALEVMRQLEEGICDVNSSPKKTNAENFKYNDEAMEIFKNLEERIDESNEIDLDSTLAPLSQINKNSENNVTGQNSVLTDDEDDFDNLNDFTMMNEDIDVVLCKLKETDSDNSISAFPQLDGNNDDLTPKKKVSQNELKSPHRSPRTLRNSRSRISLANRYAPLDVTIKSPNSKKNQTRKLSVDSECEIVSVSSDDEMNSYEILQNLKKKKRKTLQTRTVLKEFDKFNSKAIQLDLTKNNDALLPLDEQYFDSTKIKKNLELLSEMCMTDNVTSKLRSKKSADLNKTKITCNLKTPKTKNNKCLKVYNINDNEITPIKKCIIKLQRIDTSPYEISTNRLNCLESEERSDSPKAKRFKSNHETNSNEIELLKISNSFNKIKEMEINKQKASPEILQNCIDLMTIKKCKIVLERCSLQKSSSKKTKKRSWSPSDVAREYDKRNNFFPIAGPSNINARKLKHLSSINSSPLKPVERNLPEFLKIPKINLQIDQNFSTPEKNCEDVFPLTPSTHDEPILVQSFYGNSNFLDSPSLFSEIDSPTPFLLQNTPENNEQFLESTKIQSFFDHKDPNSILITPKELPPNYNEVLQNLSQFQIPRIKNIEPFYSNSEDISNNKEIGHITLKIPGKSINDLKKFSSSFEEVIGINDYRKNIFENLFASTEGYTDTKTHNQIKEYFCNEKKCNIFTYQLPPTKHESKIWLKANKILKNEKKMKNIQDDSPISVRRQKIAMIVDNNNSNNLNSSNDLETSIQSIHWSPMTPQLSNGQTKNAQNGNITTPLTSYSQNNKKSSKCRLSLTKVLNQVQLSEKYKCISTEKLLDEKLPNSLESEKSNDSISTEQALSALERSSFKKNLVSSNGDLDNSFGLSGASLSNTFGFKVNLENLQNAKADIEYNYLTTMSLEVFVPTRDDLKPNPQFDSIACIFFSIINNVPELHELPKKHSGYIIIETLENFNEKLNGIIGNKISVRSEKELFEQLLELCRFWDPDILSGYEIELNSWGYIVDRSKVLGLELNSELSRIPSQKCREISDEDRDQYTDLDFEMRFCGRILLDVWRLMRSEIALTSYTFENCMYHILHRRIPVHSYRNLTNWYSQSHLKWIVLEYYMERVNGTLELLDQLDLIGRTSEMAKLIGIQFYEVLSRGSQYRVESMMLRIAKPKNIVPLSPSVEHRANMRAPEYLPLILEPQSRFFTDPVIVLDFQSLYPSMIIAYNYCFSTCLGRFDHLGESTIPFEFGASQLRVPPKTIKKLLENDQVTISPCGVVFVKSEIREGILKRMLTEILNTRLMVKQSMKLHKTNSLLQRVLHSRQLGLKLMANVTYGYTAANFSGRMPCVEVGDSVVAKGRETLERAIKMIEANEKWQAKVIYGDTDSVFVLCKGRSRADAFKIGEEISDAVTNVNPQPVKLKLEKVYQPCILQTKKRYVGYMYESADQNEPIYEAKGIETVRRDGCPAVGKILEKTLKILFETKDVSKIKEYVCRQFTKILQGKANVQDLIYAKEFRGTKGYKPTACVPALEMTRKNLKLDPRNEPRRGERVPYVVTHGPPGVPLIRLVRNPNDFLSDPGLKINSIYYITKAIIPPLNRCLLLIGADVNDWFIEMPRKTLTIPFNKKIKNDEKKNTISQYFSSTNCLIDCGEKTTLEVCKNCMRDKTKCIVTLQNKIAKLERSFYLVQKLCQSCCGRMENIECKSLDCPVLYILENKKREQTQINHFRNLLKEHF